MSRPNAHVYAVTTKRSLYAVVRFSVLAPHRLVAVLRGPRRRSAGAGQRGRRPPCAACIAVIVDAGAGRRCCRPPSTASRCSSLRGAATTGSAGAVARGDRAAAAAGPASSLTGMPRRRAVRPRRGRRRRSSLDVRDSTLPLEQLAFGCEARLTALRAARRATLRLVVDRRRRRSAALRERDVAPYCGRPRRRRGRPRQPALAARRRLDRSARPLAATRAAPVDRGWLAVAAAADAARGALADLRRAAAPAAAPASSPRRRLRCRCGGAPAPPVPRTRRRSIASPSSPAARRRGDRPSTPATPASNASRSRPARRSSACRRRRRIASPKACEVVGARRADGRGDRRPAPGRGGAAGGARSATLISAGTLTLTFEAPGFPAPVTISARDDHLHAPGERTELEQRDDPRQRHRVPRRRRAAAADHRAGARRVAAARHHADRTSTATASPDARRVDGTALLRRRLRAASTARAAAVPRPRLDCRGRFRAWCGSRRRRPDCAGRSSSSEQADEFAASRRRRLAARAVRGPPDLQGAAHRTPIHRVLALRRHEVNPPDFDGAARRPRTLGRTDAARHAGGLSLSASGSRGRRQRGRRRRAGRCAGRAEPRVRTLAFGVIVDPNISRAAAVRRPELRGLRSVRHRHAAQRLLRRHLRPAGVLGAVDRRHADGSWPAAPSASRRRTTIALSSPAASNTTHNIRQRPAQASVWLLRPLTPRIALRVGYELDYTHFGRQRRDGAGVRRAGRPGGARPAAGARGAARRLERSVWWNPVAAHRLARLGPPGVRRVPAGAARFSALRRHR